MGSFSLQTCCHHWGQSICQSINQRNQYFEKQLSWAKPITQYTTIEEQNHPLKKIAKVFLWLISAIPLFLLSAFASFDKYLGRVTLPTPLPNHQNEVESEQEPVSIVASLSSSSAALPSSIAPSSFRPHLSVSHSSPQCYKSEMIPPQEFP